MSVYETVGRNQKQALLTLHHSNEALYELMKPFVSRTEPVWRVMRDLPYADRLPTARQAVEQWFGFFDDLLKEERDFVLHTVDVVAGHKMTHPTPRSTPKAA